MVTDWLLSDLVRRPIAIFFRIGRRSTHDLTLGGNSQDQLANILVNLIRPRDVVAAVVHVRFDQLLVAHFDQRQAFPQIFVLRSVDVCGRDLDPFLVGVWHESSDDPWAWSLVIGRIAGIRAEFQLRASNGRLLEEILWLIYCVTVQDAIFNVLLRYVHSLIRAASEW